MKTSDLTRGQRLLVDRRRRGETQRVAAARHEVSLYSYRRWELDAEDSDAPTVAIGSLKPHERCHLLRIRRGTSVQDLAADLGVSRWWLIQMEQGKVDATRLVVYWKTSGALQTA